MFKIQAIFQFYFIVRLSQNIVWQVQKITGAIPLSSPHVRVRVRVTVSVKLRFFIINQKQQKEWGEGYETLIAPNSSNGSPSLYSCKPLIHYSLPLNYDLTESVIPHISSASGMVNKKNHISNSSSTGKCLKLHQPMLVTLNYSSKYFIQNNPEVKKDPHSLFLQRSLVKDNQPCSRP